ncbi:MAG: PQQ-binding-like beta-propeller repeat protein [Acidobacteriota bacterium]|nr:PQQ-binding-like beta-propeller repeat protein [Acidobacteriota bacterium]
MKRTSETQVRSFVVSATAALAIVVGTAGTEAGAANNWPQWRGPNLDGTTNETDLPTTWSATENVAWTLEVADGSWTGATPIVWEDTIFLNVSYLERSGGGGFGGRGRGRGRRRDGGPPGGGRDRPGGGPQGGSAPPPVTPVARVETQAAQTETRRVELWRVNRRDGSVVWKQHLSDNDRQQRKQNMSSPSPVTDGEHVWVMTGTGWLRAFDFDGNERWSRNISDDYWSFGLNWGFASSPLLHEDALYVQVLHGMRTDDPSYVLRIDKMTGETVWMVERPTDAQRESPDSYTTPALLQYDGTTEIVLTGGDVVTGHDPETGAELWRSNGLNPRNNGAYRLIASPLIVGEVIIAPTRVRPMLALQAGGRGDITDSHRIWSFDDGPDVPTPVSDGELLYVVQDNGVVHALDMASGETVYTDQRIEPGTYSASPVLADGKIYATSEDGVTTVYRAGREFEVLATNSLPGYTLSTPSVSDGHLYIRAGSTLYAIGGQSN